MIVSDIPGTTRDAVDVRFEHNGRTFVAVDTAGLKRHSKGGNSIEFYGLVRAYRAIRRCDVALLMIDATSDISRVDKRLATAIEESFEAVHHHGQQVGPRRGQVHHRGVRPVSRARTCAGCRSRR